MPAPGQKIEHLVAADEDRLARQRALIESYLGNDAAYRTAYRSAAGKLDLLRALLAARAFDELQTYELQCMGIVFGDALIQRCGWQWRMVEDEYGRDPCIKVPGSSVILFPLTMISKRIERGEEVDVFDLFNSVVADAEHRLEKADPLSD